MALRKIPDLSFIIKMKISFLLKLSIKIEVPYNKCGNSNPPCLHAYKMSQTFSHTLLFLRQAIFSGIVFISIWQIEIQCVEFNILHRLANQDIMFGMGVVPHIKRLWHLCNSCSTDIHLQNSDRVSGIINSPGQNQGH